MTYSSLCRVKIIQLPVVSLCVQAVKIENPVVEVVLRPEYKDMIKCCNHPVGTGINFIFWPLVARLLPPIPKVSQRIFVCQENEIEDFFCQTGIGGGGGEWVVTVTGSLKISLYKDRRL